MVFLLCSTILGVLKELLVLVCSGFHLLLGMELKLPGSLHVELSDLFFYIYASVNFHSVFLFPSSFYCGQRREFVSFLSFSICQEFFMTSHIVYCGKNYIYTLEKIVHSSVLEWSILLCL